MDGMTSPSGPEPSCSAVGAVVCPLSATADAASQATIASSHVLFGRRFISALSQKDLQPNPRDGEHRDARDADHAQVQAIEVADRVPSAGQLIEGDHQRTE